MKTFITAAFLLITANLLAQAQATNIYGPLPYRTPEQTIGQVYKVLPISPQLYKFGYLALRRADSPNVTLYQQYQNRSIKLVSIDENDTGHFRDSINTEFIVKNISGTWSDIALVDELENGRKLMIGKTVWLNVDMIWSGPIYGHRDTLKVLRFDPVTIIDIIAGQNNEFPHYLVVKTKDGKTGRIWTSLSGTNARHNPRYLFTNLLYIDNPRKKYHFTDNEWKAIQKNYIAKGMSKDAVKLIEGLPKTFNNSSTAGKYSLDQWVYSWGYVYFTDDKVSSIESKY